jgi:carbon storage regulator CsrA
MLVLSRRCDEKIVFPGLGITLQVLQIKGHQIKIGIDAPSSVVILREELERSATLFKQQRVSLHGDELLSPLPRKG